eukprot:CAMPEP_0118693888 /NCGR_PEP_ID=MMETSP0800-20121206/12178_1 /TAXON_ID=210618 ORGANISM="Striatella unipunctata, Strain CCMP2910" /NCGR_SAMPLE_ID=MMETSP0800 /ASSEMBLY_ACC=CAM_ASM_000638 /LENGTH=59 /DNA_ID=CAMNT_0006592213 /DNA_START=122 /DNA_END=298 /DNA_ORIENTATION=+
MEASKLVIIALSVTTTAFFVATIFLATGYDRNGNAVSAAVGDGSETPAAEEIISNVPHN